MRFLGSFLIANPKGGSGKSTLATNLAGYLARCGRRVMRFLATLDLPVLTHGLTLFDLPPARVEKDLEQWRPLIDWVESA
ncbi:MAG: division plane positioning ATPase MipZ [Pseudomonadota bacterium]